MPEQKRTLREDLLDGRVLGRYYVSTESPNTVYQVQDIFADRVGGVILKARRFDSDGRPQRASDRHYLMQSLRDQRAPEDFKPK